MNFFITDNEGSHPVSLDDFRFMQEGYFEGFNALVLALVPEGTTEAILSGCVLEIDTDLLEWSLSAGFVYLDEEIFFVPAQEGTMDDAFQLPAFSVTLDYLEVDPVEYADGQEHFIHQVRTLALGFVNDPEASDELYAYDDLSDVTDLLAERLGLPDVEQDISDLEQDVSDLGEAVAVLEEDTLFAINNGVPVGFIGIIDEEEYEYFDETGAGLEDSAWEGWQVMNGNQGTRNISKMIVSAFDFDEVDPDYGIGVVSGQDEVTLEVDNLPPHSHTYNEITDDGAGSSLSGGGNDAYQKVPPTETDSGETGNAVPFSIVPTNVSLIYVKKIFQIA